MGRRKTNYMDFVRANRNEYNIWVAMKQRCSNQNCAEYANYGGRGITVCDRWLASFPAFIEDMGPKPPGFTLDRVDSDGDYEPGNCRWATMSEQCRNFRRNHLLTFNGETMCLVDWSKRLGVNHQTLRNRLKRGWSIEEALSTNRVEVGRDPNNGRITGR